MKNIYIIVASVVIFTACNTAKSTTKKEMMVVKEEVLSKELDRSIRPNAGKAKELTIGKHEEFTLANGMKVFVIENHKLPTISYSLSLDIDPVLEGDKAGYTSIVGSLLEAGTINRTKAQLDEEVDFMGANIGAYASGAYAAGLSKYKTKIMNVLADVVLNPIFPKSEFDKLIKQTLTGIESQADSPDAITANIKSLVFYGKNHPYGEFITKQTISNIDLNDCKDYYNSYFNPQKALLTIVGDITKEEAEKLVKKNFKDWKNNKEIEVEKYETVKAVKSNRVTIVNKVDAVQSNITMGNIANLKLGDKDYEAVVVLNQIFGSGFSGRLFQNLREDREYTYGAYGAVSSDKLIGNFNAYAKVRNEVTDSAIDQFLFEINKIRTENVGKDELKNAKSSIVGTFAQSLESPRTLASFAANIEEYNLNKDYFKGYLKRIELVTVEDVKRVANKYMTPNNLNIIVVGDASNVGPKLARFGDLVYLDKDGKEISAPNLEEIKIEEGITANTVIEKYIEAIGGKTKVELIKAIVSEYKMEMQGMEILIKSSYVLPNKKVTEISVPAMGMVMQKEVFNGVKGYSERQGVSKPYTEKEIKDNKVSAAVIPELKYIKNGVKTVLLGVKKVNEVKAYELEVVMPSGDKSKAYFDVNTGLKIKETSTQSTPQGDMIIVGTFSDYKEVSGVKFPHKMNQKAGGQEMKMIANSIKTNVEVEDSVFEVK